MGRKKKKPVQRNLSLKERLAGYWQAAKWETFAALYLRDPEASSRTPFAQRWPDVLYNCLTKALFINRDPHSAREFASRLLNGTEDAAKTDVARVALDFLNMRADASIKPSPLIAEERLPAPWRELRAALLQAASQPKKRGRRASSPGVALLKKLQTRFAALSKAGTLTPFTGFLQLAEELEGMAKGTAAEHAARCIRAQAVLLRDLGKRRGREADGMRDLAWLEKHRQFRELVNGSMPAAALGMWDFFCLLGGRKFGRDWENAVRTLRLAFDRRTDPELLTAFREVVFLSFGKSRLFWLTQAEKYGRWSEQERYLLSFLAVCESCLDDKNFMSEAAVRMFPHRIKTVTEIGRARRPESPWPVQMAEMLEDMLLEQSNEAVPLIARLDIPYESQTDAGLVLLALRMGYQKNIRNSAAAHRLPLSLTEEEISDIASSLLFHLPKAAMIDELASMINPDAFSSLADHWVRFAIAGSGFLTVTGRKTLTPWDRMTEGQTLRILSATLRAGSLPWAFCRLCQGMGRRRLSDDETLRREFCDILQKELTKAPGSGRISPASQSERDPEFLVGLFLMLTAWPQADSRMMQPLFSLALSSFDAEHLCDIVLQAIDAIKEPDRKKEIIACVRSVLDKIPHRRVTREIEYARNALRVLSK